ncbi:MAG: excinuclease ABC subunit UvrC [Pseudomonadota bacterium]
MSIEATDQSQPASDEPEKPTETGPQIIAGYLKTLPSAPGVYRMLNPDGDVIYVGKARSLKARVSNYARLGGHTNRIARMISATASMEFVTVRTEAEALLLEANLIKRFRPRFNVLMRDDKSFPYIRIARDHAAPRILKHRGARTAKDNFFGPFASAGAVDRTINMLQRAFLLRTCSDSVYDSRTRPCLLFQIKRCAGPCTGEISEVDYKAQVDEAVSFLRGESQNVRNMYQSLMEEAAEALEFERAAKYRNRLWALAHVTSDQSINAESVEEADVFAAFQEGGQTCIQVFFFRSGQNWGNRAYYPKADRSLSAEDVLESFIAQFYDDKPVPKQILLSHDIPSRALLAEALATKADRKVTIQVPQRGAKTDLVAHAVQNAKEALGRKMAETSSQRALLKGTAERFNLARVPRRIEVYDNSHIQGENAVGAMIVAGPDGLVKNAYRKFNIKSADITAGDDYAMMREVLTRRLKRLAVEDDDTSGNDDEEALTTGNTEAVSTTSDAAPPIDNNAHASETSRITEPAPPSITERGADAIAFGVLPADQPFGGDNEDTELSDDVEEEDDDVFPDRPDLILVDGGAGQLGIACEVAAELGIDDIAIIGVAKGPDRDAGREHFHIPGRGRSLMLEQRDPVLYFVQRLRDEAHRFAIGAHRAKRAKKISANPLDEITGIGPTRKRALLKHFGSAKAVSRAGVEDLKDVSGISAEMAQKIYDFFHER